VLRLKIVSALMPYFGPFWRQASAWSYKIPATLPPFCLFFFFSSSYLPCFEYPSSRFGVFSWEGLHCTARSRSLLHCPSGPWEAQFLIYPLRFHCDGCYMQAHEEDARTRDFGDAILNMYFERVNVQMYGQARVNVIRYI
jgi:hypothetical protein